MARRVREMRRITPDRSAWDGSPEKRGHIEESGPVSFILRSGRADDPSRVVGTGRLDRKTRGFYRDAILALQRDTVPFLVGGAYALAHYVGVTRHTRDFDVFVKRSDAEAALSALAAAGCRTEIAF